MLQILGNERIVEMLIRNGANAKTVAQDGTTPLHDAALNGKLKRR